MKYFYSIYDSQNIKEIVEYSFGFHGYIDTLLGINTNLKQKKISKCKFKNKMKLKFTNMYHPSVENPVKNNLNLDKNIIVTGPNAAGKTTLIKATIINILFSQQLGFDF